MEAKGKKFFANLTKKEMVWGLITVFSLLLFLGVTMVSHHLTGQLSDQQAAKRWDADGKSVQVSCYFEDGTDVTDRNFEGFRKQLEQMLKETLQEEESVSENGKRLVVDAYSAQGTITISSERTTLEKVNAIGIGGDFFLFHPLKLLTGGYFSGNDLMQDSILLDAESAWQLFGSNDVVGKSVTIGGVPHYVSGVFEREDSRFAKSAGLDRMTVYLSADSLLAYGTTSGIHHYEVLAPNPVQHYVYHAVKEKLGVAEESMIVVENTTRFQISSLISVILDFGVRSMRKSNISFPYWENVARGYEDVCALLLIFQFLLLLIPITVLFIFLLWKWKHKNFTWKDLCSKIIDIKDCFCERRRKEKEKWEDF